MKGKELIYNLFNKKETDTIPWVPFAGVHSGKLVDYTAKEVLQDEEKLLESLLEVNRIYHPDGQPVMFDLQIEAEILGCDLKWAEDSPPTVVSHPLADCEEIPDKIPTKTEGRIPLVLEVMNNMKDKVGKKTALYGLVCGPLTLASHLRGTDLFMDIIMKPDYVNDLLAYTEKIIKKMSDYYIEAGMDIIAVVDPMVSQISPDHFHEYLSNVYRRIFNYIGQQNSFSSFFVCGDASNLIEEMCLTEPDCIAIDENVDLAEAKKITDRYDIIISGNIPLTTVMLFGNQQDNMKCVIELIDSVNKVNLIISPGCDMPYDVPVENPIAVEQAVHQPKQVREGIKSYQKAREEISVSLPDYENLDRPLVEVFTLDSDTCAACTYMLAAALDAEEYFGEKINVVEYKYNSPENIARITEMGVKKLPSIYINGELKYSSLVPNRENLIKEIEECL